jgi:hypothetical protein
VRVIRNSRALAASPGTECCQEPRILVRGSKFRLKSPPGLGRTHSAHRICNQELFFARAIGTFQPKASATPEMATRSDRNLCL